MPSVHKSAWPERRKALLSCRSRRRHCQCHRRDRTGGWSTRRARRSFPLSGAAAAGAQVLDAGPSPRGCGLSVRADHSARGGRAGAKASPRSASAGRDARTRNPRLRAASMPASHNVDLPIPASPSSTRAAGRAGTVSRNSASDRSSHSLPAISTGIAYNESDTGRPRIRWQRPPLAARAC
jgi:hypothetical protein